jgi:hypothetical protein
MSRLSSSSEDDEEEGDGLSQHVVELGARPVVAAATMAVGEGVR